MSFYPGPLPSSDKATGRQSYAKNFYSPYQESGENPGGALTCRGPEQRKLVRVVLPLLLKFSEVLLQAKVFSAPF